MAWKEYWQGFRIRLAGDDLKWTEPLEFRRLHYEFEWRGAGWWKRPVAVSGVLAGLVTQHLWQFLPGSPNDQNHCVFYVALVGAAVVVVYGERHLLRWLPSTVKMNSRSITRSALFRQKTWAYKKLAGYQIGDNGAFQTLILYPKKDSPIFLGLGPGASIPKIKVLLRKSEVPERTEEAALAN